MNALSEKYLDGNPFGEDSLPNNYSALGIESISEDKRQHFPGPVLNFISKGQKGHTENLMSE